MEEDQKEITTVSVVFEQIEKKDFRDLLLKTGRLSPIFSIINHMWDQNDFDKMVKIVSPMLVESLNDYLIETPSTQRLSNSVLKWGSDLHCIYFETFSAVITRDEL